MPTSVPEPRPPTRRSSGPGATAWLLLLLAPTTMAHTCVFEHEHDDPDGTGGAAGTGATAGSGGIAGGGGESGAGTGGSGAGGSGAGGSGAGGSGAGGSGAGGSGAGGSAAGGSGTGGTGTGGTGTGGTGTGGTGTGGAGGTTVEPCDSFECGDGCRDPLTEECDDGNLLAGDSCSSLCAVLDTLVGPGEPPDPGSQRAPPGRTLGDGRHPVAGGEFGFAVAYIEPGAGDPEIAVRTYDSVGVPDGPGVAVSRGARPVSFASPNVAALPGGSFAVAWTDYATDSDELDIVLTRFAPGATGPDLAPRTANQVVLGAQYDADVIWADGELVVAWVDTSDAATAPDLRFRTFSAGLAATGVEETLADSTDAEGGVTLASFAGSWAAAWRASSGAMERIVVDTAGARWETPEFLPVDATERPALTALDDGRLFLVYTAATAAGSGTSYDTSLYAALLDVNEPGLVAPVALETGANGAAEGRPALVRAGANVVLTWASAAEVADPKAEETWLKIIGWDADAGVLDLSAVEMPLPRREAHRFGDQRAPAVAVLPYGDAFAAITVWDDYGRVFGELSGAPDIVAEMIPLPVLRDDNLLEAVGE